jgi:GWxTD domain-containing protein
MFCKTLVIFCAACFLAAAQQPQRETIAKPLSDKEKKKRDQNLRRELDPAYDTWRKVDVAYIITDEESQAFDRLSNNEERDSFIEQFWLRRDPTPDTEENEFKEEHYRRMAYANERFASGIPGWKTDRGEIYIKYGPPAEIESHPSGGTYQRPVEEGGGNTSTFPFEKWRYRYLENVGTDVVIEFVDRTMSGEYRMTTDPSEKDALSHVPGHQQQLDSNTSGSRAGRSQLDLVERDVNLRKPPAIKFKDLEAAVTSSIRYNTLPMKVRTDFIPVTPTSILSNITLQFDRKDLQFQQKEGYSKAVINLYARITTMSRRTVNVFEDVISVDALTGSLEKATAGSSIYQKAVPLAPGRYRLNIAAKDVVGGNTASYETVLDVPQFDEDQLAASSLILADVLEHVPARNIGAGQFVIGPTKVRPRVGEIFRNDEKLGFYVQLHHFLADPATHKPNGTIEYEIVKTGTSEVVFAYHEDLQGAASEVTIERLLPLNRFAPGSYTFRITVVDKIRNQTITPSATFQIVNGTS